MVAFVRKAYVVLGIPTLDFCRHFYYSKCTLLKVIVLCWSLIGCFYFLCFVLFQLLQAIKERRYSACLLGLEVFFPDSSPLPWLFSLFQCTWLQCLRALRACVFSLLLLSVILFVSVCFALLFAFLNLVLTFFSWMPLRPDFDPNSLTSAFEHSKSRCLCLTEAWSFA